ncbi:unnamed protein product [Phytophthora lilii]|uniref:Unnamed protein product n=1 Tax=Phytophthora lilii TaxID=2077276 RepID=A0A9W6TYE6_9STRA|nr:unnamed protein product [Phytophthora lilii]
MRATYSESKPVRREFTTPSDRLPRGDRSHSPEQLRRPRSPPTSMTPQESQHQLTNRTRRQLLERRIVSFATFKQEVEQDAGAGAANVNVGDALLPIPVPLHSGESMGLYDHRFWTWLKDYNETKNSLWSNPARERRFRMAFAYLRVKPQGSSALSAQSVEASSLQNFRPSVEARTKIPLGVLKSARARLLMNPKRQADDANQNEQSPAMTSSKRARTDTEDGNQARDLPSSHFNENLLRKERAVPPKSSTIQALPQSKLPATTTSTSSTQASMTKAATPVPSSAAIAGPVVPTARLSAPPMQKKQIPVLAKSVPSSMESRPSIAPEQTSKQNTLASAVSSIGSSSSRLLAVPTQRKTIPQATQPVTSSAKAAEAGPHVVPVQPTKSIIATALNAAPKTNVSRPGDTLVPTATQRNDAATARMYSDASQSIAVALTKPLEATTSVASISTTEPANSQETSRPPSALKPNPSESTALKQVSNLSSNSTFLLAVPAAAATSAVPQAIVQNDKPSDTDSRSTPTASAGKSTGAIESNSTDVAQSDAVLTPPEPTQHESPNELSDAETNPADESEEHDGDVMNPDGCCCTKCMRSWAKTLTERMDQLEENVLGLKRDVIDRASGQLAFAAGS